MVYSVYRNSKRKETRKREQICGRIFNFAKIEPQAPLLVVSLNQKGPQLSVNIFLSELCLLSPCRYHSPLKATKAKCYCFCSRECPICPCLAVLGLFSPFVAQNFSSKSGFITFLHSMDPNFMQRS